MRGERSGEEGDLRRVDEFIARIATVINNYFYENTSWVLSFEGNMCNCIYGMLFFGGDFCF